MEIDRPILHIISDSEAESLKNVRIVSTLDHYIPIQVGSFFAIDGAWDSKSMCIEIEHVPVNDKETRVERSNSISGRPYVEYEVEVVSRIKFWTTNVGRIFAKEGRAWVKPVNRIKPALHRGYIYKDPKKGMKLTTYVQGKSTHVVPKNSLPTRAEVTQQKVDEKKKDQWDEFRAIFELAEKVGQLAGMSRPEANDMYQGFAWVFLSDARTPFAKWIMSNGLGMKGTYKGVLVSIRNPEAGNYNGSMMRKEEHAAAMALCLSEHGISCSVQSRAD